MYYTIRPAGPRTKKQQLQYFLSIAGYVLRVSAYLAFGLVAVMALITGNWGALALLCIAMIVLGVPFNLFNLRSWLPGWKNGTWFTRIVSITVYIFTALSVLLVATPRP